MPEPPWFLSLDHFANFLFLIAARPRPQKIPLSPDLYITVLPAYPGSTPPA
uniref:Uncharacterized protein n=1 Tax=Anguilla anguilla TaxID=7936 RepID=A0A0E9VLJ2_ANGAN